MRNSCDALHAAPPGMANASAARPSVREAMESGVAATLDAASPGMQSTLHTTVLNNLSSNAQVDYTAPLRNLTANELGSDVYVLDLMKPTCVES